MMLNVTARDFRSDMILSEQGGGWPRGLF